MRLRSIRQSLSFFMGFRMSRSFFFFFNLIFILFYLFIFLRLNFVFSFSIPGEELTTVRKGHGEGLIARIGEYR